MKLDDLNTRELLSLISEVLDELRRREVIRSANNPVADYAEHLVTQAFGLTLAAKSTTGYDALDAAGQRYEIKARRLTKHNNSTQLSVIRDLDQRHFDVLTGVLFREDFSILRACLVPHEIVSTIAVHRKYVRGWVLHLRNSVWEIPGVFDITAQILAVQRANP